MWRQPGMPLALYVFRNTKSNPEWHCVKVQSIMLHSSNHSSDQEFWENPWSDIPRAVLFERSNFPISRNLPCLANVRTDAWSLSPANEFSTMFTPRPPVNFIISDSKELEREFRIFSGLSCGKRCNRKFFLSSVPTVVNTCKQHQNELKLDQETKTDNIVVSIEKGASLILDWKWSQLDHQHKHCICSIKYTCRLY